MAIEMPFKNEEERKRYHREYNRKHYQDNKEYYKNKKKEWYKKNPKKAKEITNKYSKDHYNKNKEKYKAKARKWCKDNRDRYLEIKMKFYIKQREQRISEGKCVRCGIEMDPDYILLNNIEHTCSVCTTYNRYKKRRLSGKMPYI